VKRILSLLLALVLLLPGCGSKAEEDSTTAQDAETITRVMLAFLDENEEADDITWYRELSDVESYITDCYKLEDVPLSDGAIARIEGARAFELAVLQVDEENMEMMTQALQEYLLSRKGDFAGYFPDQAELVDNALVLTKGGWAALSICRNQEAAQFGFESCFGDGFNARGIPAALGPDPEDLRPDGRLIYKDPDIEDMTPYDTSAILAAWESGNDSGLSRKDRKILNAAKSVLEECVTPDMSDYEKEEALYIWLSRNVRYDTSHHNSKEAPRTSYEPYGPLINGKGVCLGYATAFQLLMDMAGVECMTVTGASNLMMNNHAWNMVKLNGEWYCADPTWDNRHGPGHFTYFNVTSQHMADTDHQWDYDNTPEATAEDGGRP